LRIVGSGDIGEVVSLPTGPRNEAARAARSGGFCFGQLVSNTDRPAGGCVPCVISRRRCDGALPSKSLLFRGQAEFSMGSAATGEFRLMPDSIENLSIDLSMT
jgi:hypothetical protein